MVSNLFSSFSLAQLRREERASFLPRGNELRRRRMGFTSGNPISLIADFHGLHY